MDQQPQLIQPPNHEEIMDFIKLQSVDIYSIFDLKESATDAEIQEAIENTIVRPDDENTQLAIRILQNKRLRFLYDNFYSGNALKRANRENVKSSLFNFYELLHHPLVNFSSVMFASKGITLTPEQIWKGCASWKWLFRGLPSKISLNFILRFTHELSGTYIPFFINLPLGYLITYPVILINSLSTLSYQSSPSILTLLDKILDHQQGGIKNLFYGLAPYLLTNVAVVGLNTVLDYANAYFQHKRIESPDSKPIKYLSNLFSSELFKVLSIFTVSIPCNVITFQYQSQILTGGNQSLVALTKSLFNTYGLYKFYYGYAPQLLSVCSILSFKHLLNKF